MSAIPASEDGPQRVQKILAAAGIGSRRACERLIAQGRVAVNGRPVTLGDRAQTRDHITLDGERVHTDASLVYLLLNKPMGTVTTAADPQGRPTVLALVPPTPRVFPVGRLDLDTTGLLLLTNDGELANRLTHPRYEVPKTYVAQIRGPVRRHVIRSLLDGVVLDDGPAKAVAVRELGRAQDQTLIELTLTEGRKREVRRMLAAVGLNLVMLARVQVGPLQLGDIAPSKHRPLTGAEVRALYGAVGLDEASLTPSGGRARRGGTGR